MSSSVSFVFRQTKCHAPPGRRSISQTGIVHPSGPVIQCGTCSGFVQASQTRRRGASTTRVMTTSRSVGVVSVVVPTLFAFAVATFLLLGFEVLEKRIESVVIRVPDAAIALGPLGHFLERRRLEPHRTPLRLATARDEAGPLQDSQVLGDGRPAHRE